MITFWNVKCLPVFVASQFPGFEFVGLAGEPAIATKRISGGKCMVRPYRRSFRSLQLLNPACELLFQTPIFDALPLGRWRIVEPIISSRMRRGKVWYYLTVRSAKPGTKNGIYSVGHRIRLKNWRRELNGMNSVLLLRRATPFPSCPTGTIMRK